MLEADKPPPDDRWSAHHAIGSESADRSRVDGSSRAVTAQAMVERLSLPHVVIVVDTRIGDTSVVGPFADVIAAAAFAERLAAEVGASDGELAITVAGLEPGR